MASWFAAGEKRTSSMIDWFWTGNWLRHVGLPLAAALLGIWLGYRYNVHQQNIGAERERALCQQRAHQQAQALHTREMNWMTELSHAQSQAQQSRALAQSAQRSADAAGRLFSATLGTQRERALADAPGACSQYASTISAVLDECQAAYREVAGQADGHAADALMLQQAWPK